MEPVINDNFIVITGGPGAGKTALIRELEHRGYRCVDEAARELIAEQLDAEGTALPWKDKERYKQMMFDRSVEHYRHTEGGGGPVFFDRGIPDTLCYATLEGLQQTVEMKEYAEGLRYNKTVFLLPPWEAIYENDRERRQSWDEAVRTCAQMKQTYLDYGYHVVEVPPAPVAYRAELIIKTVTEDREP